MTSPAAAIRSAPERTFVRVRDLPGSRAAARQAASRAVTSGDLVPVRSGIYYRGVKTRYGMTPPRVEDVATEVLGTVGVGPAGYSAAREWGVTTQVPATFHVTTPWLHEPILGVTQHARSNRRRLSLNAKEIALLELLRAPEAYVEAGWSALVTAVRHAFRDGEVHPDRLTEAVSSERNVAVRANYGRLESDVTAP